MRLQKWVKLEDKKLLFGRDLWTPKNSRSESSGRSPDSSTFERRFFRSKNLSYLRSLIAEAITQRSDGNWQQRATKSLSSKGGRGTFECNLFSRFHIDFRSQDQSQRVWMLVVSSLVRDTRSQCQSHHVQTPPTKKPWNPSSRPNTSLTRPNASLKLCFSKTNLNQKYMFSWGL